MKNMYVFKMLISKLCFVIGCATIIIPSTIWVISMTSFQDSPISGQGPAIGSDQHWTDYGWYGGKQRLILLDLTQIGGVGNGDGRCTSDDWAQTPLCGIDYTDKRKVTAKLFYRESYNATPRYYACDNCSQSTCDADFDDCEIDDESLWQYAEIEFKGDWVPERRQANFDLEFGDDITPFDFTEKTDDWILRGSYLDRGLVRDATASVNTSFTQRPYESRMVDLIILNDGKFTYEGAYNMMQKIKRGALRDFDFPREWESKGKVKTCDDLDPNEVQEMSILFKAEECNRQNRGACSPVEEQYQIKTLEPKDYVLDPNDDPEKHEDYANCTAELEAFYSNYFAVPDMLPGYEQISLDIPSFANAFVQCQLMQQADFGYRGASFYFLKLPEDPVLYAGPLYDFDSMLWRVMPIDSIDFYSDSTKTYTFWHNITKQQSFIRYLRENGITVLDAIYTEIDQLYQTRLDMASNGEFENHEARWPMGKVASSFVIGYYLLYGSQLYPASNIYNEIAEQKQHTKERYEHMKTRLIDISSIEIASYNNINLFFRHQWWLLLCLALGFLAILSGTLALCCRFSTVKYSSSLDTQSIEPRIPVTNFRPRELEIQRQKERYR